MNELKSLMLIILIPSCIALLAICGLLVKENENQRLIIDNKEYECFVKMARQDSINEQRFNRLLKK